MPKGIIVTKPVTSVNRDTVKEMVPWNLIQAITRKMPLVRKKRPDFNVLDLGFFNTIQSLQYRKVSTSIDEFIKFSS